ncbi:hypothetical protein KEU06_08800 [Pseudaminobacter sp. 19-2017]|uniref:Uncharacterized protein n=1 Tax=Pseudaminobacter soli (ex Zhang et al. 2022) TaxID=2831468 RepID=A0A942I8Y3_9HYPH|nr:hypothetical protein [Pseudaminobacter soli]MBS3648726.1 hypothetical protein [Pseudaminobacter soli]
MSTAVATRTRTEIAQESAYDPFAAAGNDLGGSSAVYAKFNGNSGEFSYGQSAQEIEAEERLVADVANARRGWICWKDEEVVDEIMVPILQGPPPGKHELTDHGPYEKHADGTQDGWSEQFAIDLRPLGADHAGVQIVYKTTTKSALRPLGDLLKDYGRQYKNHPGELPVVEFTKGSYMPKEKKHGKKHYPIFKIVDWMSEEDLIAQYGDGRTVSESDSNSNLIEEEKPKSAPRETKAIEQQAAPAAEPEVDDEEAALMRQLEEARARKAAAAEQAAAATEAPPAETTTKPVPAERTTRRRSF